MPHRQLGCNSVLLGRAIGSTSVYTMERKTKEEKREVKKESSEVKRVETGSGAKLWRRKRQRRKLHQQQVRSFLHIRLAPSILPSRKTHPFSCLGLFDPALLLLIPLLLRMPGTLRCALCCVCCVLLHTNDAQKSSACTLYRAGSLLRRRVRC